MAKLSYFDQDAADLDDALLVQAIEKGHVPRTCLLGGVLVTEAVKANRDPCGLCACPKREACGGRAQTESLETLVIQGEARFASGEAGARKLERRGWGRELLRAGMDAEKRRKT